MLLDEHADAGDFADGLWRLITLPYLRRKIAKKAIKVRLLGEMKFSKRNLFLSTRSLATPSL